MATTMKYWRPYRRTIWQRFARPRTMRAWSSADIGVISAGDDAPHFVQDGELLNFARRSFSHF